MYLVRDGKYYSINNESALKDRPDYSVGKIYDKESSYAFNKDRVLEYQSCHYGYDKGTEFTASWYEGTTYNEYKVVANRKVYRPEKEEPKYDFAGELHPEGYATYSFEGVEPGIYYCVLHGTSNKMDILEGQGFIIIE